tara:strand:- start:601 stop:753 length:153 start_codon:yes stop_codon:yes gene_type:complete
MDKIIHWGIKITKLDQLGNKYEEYLDCIPDWVAKNVDIYLDEIEKEGEEE